MKKLPSFVPGFRGFLAAKLHKIKGSGALQAA